MRFLRWVLGALQDPISADLSSTRLSGIACVASACVLAFLHPEHPATIAALLGGGAGAFFSRTKSDSP